MLPIRMVRTAALLRENGRAPVLTVEALERIGIPVCVAVGTKDDTVSVAESQAAADVIVNGQCPLLATRHFKAHHVFLH